MKMLTLAMIALLVAGCRERPRSPAAPAEADGQVLSEQEAAVAEETPRATREPQRTAAVTRSPRDSGTGSAPPRVATQERTTDRKDLVETGGLLYAKDEAIPFTGVAVLNHPNGKVATRILYSEGKADGPAVTFDSEGRKTSETFMRQGKIDGMLTMWYPNGRKMTEVTYVQGEKQGIQTDWWPNGNRRERQEYRDGKPYGEGMSWDQDGL